MGKKPPTAYPVIGTNDGGDITTSARTAVRNLLLASRCSRDTNHAYSMEYQYLLILVHRPWTSRRLHPVPFQGNGYRDARETCIRSSCKIAGYLAKFEKSFGCKRLDVETLQILPSAALILIFSAVCDGSSGSARAEVLSGLNTILRALDELSNTYDSARQHLDGLLHVQQRWYANYRSGPTKRCGDASGSAPNSIKRQRT